MDDSCAVCADDLEWVAYGSCGHREVCSTCVVRMRFVLGDRHCCICKVESPIIFVTKAMGDYTRVMTDFSQFPEGGSEGQVGSYWYHEDTQAFFDDVDHYRMIKAMCRLSCSVCDVSGDDVEGGAGLKRNRRFKNIDQLKSHLYHRHRFFMCTLCLEGRKVFICEQKLYTRAQLSKHTSSGDPEVDGSESERGGFMGHPMCKFCKSHFYGDNELYVHMSTEHYTCHICQRQHPGQYDYDYFKNYEHLEDHFRLEHFLCENESCLAKKFVVFQSESELKRHNAIEHGGNMSRSQRNAALQIPTSFRYRRVEHEQRRGRRRGIHSDSSDNQLAMAIQASLERANLDSRPRHSALSSQTESERLQTDVDGITGQLESLATASDSGLHLRPPAEVSRSSGNAPFSEDSSFPPLSDREPVETSSRYAQALIQGSGSSTSLGQESFPPLPGSLEVCIPKPSQLASKSIAVHLRQRSKMSLKAPQAKPARQPDLRSCSPVNSPQLWPMPNQELGQNNSANSQSGIIANHFPHSSSVISHAKTTKESEFPLPSAANPAWSLKSKKGLSHSTSAPNLVAKGSSGNLTSFPPALILSNETHSSGESLKMEDVHTANKTLVERILTSLGMDEDKFTAFKSISSEYRQGLLDTHSYLSYVEQFGLLHLVPELARLCPDVQKQKELVDNISLQSKGHHVSGSSSSVKSSRGKGKCAESLGISSSKDMLADSILAEVKKLQANYKPQEEVEVLSKDGYRASNGRSVTVTSGESPSSTSVSVKSDADIVISGQNSGTGSSKQHPKKMSKFHRLRLGDGSASTFLDLHRSDTSPERSNESDTRNSRGGLGVWRNGGGQKLFATSRDPAK